MKFKEIEFKYDAKNLSFSSFNAFCKLRGNSTFKIASGYDHFYDKKFDVTTFCRHRVGSDSNQLTFKRKLTADNSYIRTEHNLDLTKASQEQIKVFLAEFDYKYNFSLYKDAFIYEYEDYILVYYVCYNSEMKEIGRFLEIEVAEDGPFATEQEAWNKLVEIEKSLMVLGIFEYNRVKESLFEMFKETK